jgi:tellurite resistance protein
VAAPTNPAKEAAVQTQPTFNASAAPIQSASSIRNLPVSLFGAVMGLAGLSLAWRWVAQTQSAPAVIGQAVGLLAVALFLLLAGAYLAKAATHPDAVRAEFDHPVSGNFFGTIAIALLLLSSVLEPYGNALAQGVWVLGTVLTIALAYVVLFRLLRGGLDSALAVPAWLIPGVATLDITVTGAHMPFEWAPQLNLFALAVGAVLALVFFTLIVSRLIHRDPLAPPMLPSLMIMVAPFEVGFLAYVNFTGMIDAFAALLFFFGLFVFAVVAPRIFRREVPFTPTWWAISFPMAALVNAALKYADTAGSAHLTAVAWMLLVFLTITLAVLAVRTARAVFSGKLLAG